MSFLFKCESQPRSDIHMTSKNYPNKIQLFSHMNKHEHLTLSILDNCTTQPTGPLLPAWNVWDLTSELSRYWLMMTLKWAPINNDEIWSLLWHCLYWENLDFLVIYLSFRCSGSHGLIGLYLYGYPRYPMGPNTSK